MSQIEQFFNSSQMPVGTILEFKRGAVPSGYLALDGREISQTTYSNLYSLLGNSTSIGGANSFKKLFASKPNQMFNRLQVTNSVDANTTITYFDGKYYYYPQVFTGSAVLWSSSNLTDWDTEDLPYTKLEHVGDTNGLSVSGARLVATGSALFYLLRHGYYYKTSGSAWTWVPTITAGNNIIVDVCYHDGYYYFFSATSTAYQYSDTPNVNGAPYTTWTTGYAYLVGSAVSTANYLLFSVHNTGATTQVHLGYKATGTTTMTIRTGTVFFSSTSGNSGAAYGLQATVIDGKYVVPHSSSTSKFSTLDDVTNPSAGTFTTVTCTFAEGSPAPTLNSIFKVGSTYYYSGNLCFKSSALDGANLLPLTGYYSASLDNDHQVAYHSNVYVFTGRILNGTRTIVSYDRSTSTAKFSDAGVINVHQVATTGTKFFASKSTASNQDSLTSTDGVTWTVNSSVLPSAQTWRGARYCNGVAFYLASNSPYTAVARSTDGATTWSAATLSFASTTNYLGAMAGDGSNTIILTAGTSTGSINRSTDNGATWSTVATGFTNTWRWAAYNSSTSTFMLMGTDGGTIVSTDGGATWSAGASTGSSTMVGLVVQGGYFRTYLNSAGSAMFGYIETTNGSSWSSFVPKVNTEVTDNVGSATVSKSIVLNGNYLSCFDGYLLSEVDTSSNYAVTHRFAISEYGAASSSYFSSTNGEAIFLDTFNGISKSTDGVGFVVKHRTWDITKAPIVAMAKAGSYYYLVGWRCNAQNASAIYRTQDFSTFEYHRTVAHNLTTLSNNYDYLQPTRLQTDGTYLSLNPGGSTACTPYVSSNGTTWNSTLSSCFGGWLYAGNKTWITYRPNTANGTVISNKPSGVTTGMAVTHTNTQPQPYPYPIPVYSPMTGPTIIMAYTATTVYHGITLVNNYLSSIGASNFPTFGVNTAATIGNNYTFGAAINKGIALIASGCGGGAEFSYSPAPCVTMFDISGQQTLTSKPPVFKDRANARGNAASGSSVMFTTRPVVSIQAEDDYFYYFLADGSIHRQHYLYTGDDVHVGNPVLEVFKVPTDTLEYSTCVWDVAPQVDGNMFLLSARGVYTTEPASGNFRLPTKVHPQDHEFVYAVKAA